jgi:hypothetical protein
VIAVFDAAVDGIWHFQSTFVFTSPMMLSYNSEARCPRMVALLRTPFAFCSTMRHMGFCALINESPQLSQSVSIVSLGMSVCRRCVVLLVEAVGG